MDKKIEYIGSFPPPYGGVSVKNQLLYETLSASFNVYRNNTRNKTLNQVRNIIDIIARRRTFIIGVSASRGKSQLITSIMFFFNKASMKKSIYFMMGGLESKKISENKKLKTRYKLYKKIFVETESMKRELSAAGLKNVSIFPNCRTRPKHEFDLKVSDGGRLKCVFFSNIQLIKGVDNIIEAAKVLPEIDFYFYGHIDKDLEERFTKAILESKNIKYMGVFDGKKNDVYLEMHQYDVLLFPTRWKNEGVPGVLVEAKIAGLAEIVSDIAYNRDLVSNNISGIVLQENTVKCLRESIELLNRDRELLAYLKKKSLLSAGSYYIDNNMKEIAEILEN